MHRNSSKSPVAVCTIVAKNYLAFARTLMASVAAVHPDWQRYVLLADERQGLLEQEPGFQLVDLKELSLPDARKFCYRYSILELSTAVKPWLCSYLFRERGFERVIYLDPDICLYQRMGEVERALDQGALMVLTPHLTRELNDGKRPAERDILRAGCFNLGFIALSRHPELSRFLAWWQSQLEYDCRISPDEGLFVDQRWMDLAPGLFQDVAILRDEGYNVAYWNLNHRPIKRSGGDYRVNGRPLVFFHFSGIDPLTPAMLSRHQNRFRTTDLGDGAELVADYCRIVLSHGYETCRDWPYAFANLADGSCILDSMRRLYRSDPAVQQEPDPFFADHAYLNESCATGDGPLTTRLMQQIWQDRPDLQQAFPDIDRLDRAAFAHWFAHDFAEREGLAARFFEPVRMALQVAPPLASERWASFCIRWIVKPLLRLMLCTGLVPLNKELLLQIWIWLRPAARLLPDSFRRLLKVELHQLWRERRSSLSVLDRLMKWGSRAMQWVARRCKQPLAIRGNDAPSLPAGRAYQRAGTSPQALADGLNIIGYVRSEHGVGESARLCAQTAEAVGLAFSLHEVRAGNPQYLADNRWRHRLRTTNNHRVNLIHVNADQLPAAYAELGQGFFAGRYNIGYWHWELPDFPRRYAPAFDLVDEIWVPSGFVRDAVAALAPCPVLVMPHAVHCKADPGVQRADFGLPEDSFLFLSMFDAASVTARKNPQGAVQAFGKAFSEDSRVRLVVKIHNGHQAAQEELQRELASVPGVIVIDRTLRRQEVYNLQSLCDVFVSLHRAEGFGLGLAEAMCLGRPVVGTNWSGNREFMTPDNSCLVDCRLLRLDRDYGPYERGQRWAEPDLDHAACQMRKLVDDPAWYRELAARGQHTIRTAFSPQVIGKSYLRRLGQITGPDAVSAAA